jgi:hypothetical protein
MSYSYNFVRYVYPFCSSHSRFAVNLAKVIHAVPTLSRQPTRNFLGDRIKGPEALEVNLFQIHVIGVRGQRFIVEHERVLLQVILCSHQALALSLIALFGRALAVN